MSLDIITLALAKSYADQQGGGGGQVQSDWNQNDDTKPDYVKNRPFYTETSETVLFEEQTVPFSSMYGIYGANIPEKLDVVAGQTYKVYWDGTGYECICVQSGRVLLIGNVALNGTGTDTGEPFLMMFTKDSFEVGTNSTDAEHTISISKVVSDGVVKIDEKYLPDNSPLILYYNFGEIEGTIDDRTNFIVFKNHDASNPELAEPIEVGKAFLTKGVVIVNVGKNYFYKPDEYNPNDKSLGSSNLTFRLKPMA